MPAHRQVEIYCQLRGPGTEQHHRQEGEEEVPRRIFSWGYTRTLYVYTGYLRHVTNDEFVNWYYYQRDYVRERTQQRNYIENNKLQDPFYQQVFVPLFLAKGKEKDIYIKVSHPTGE